MEKDWKKEGKDFRSNKGMINIVKLRNGYKINLYPRNFGGVKGLPTNDTRFKTKSQALKFAKAYMRKH